MTHVCQEFGRSRQSFYQQQSRHSKQLAEEKRIVEQVNTIRENQPMIGARKLQRTINHQRLAHQAPVGRDRLFTILRRNNLLVRLKKSYVKTTNSYHRFRVYKNLIKGLNVSASDQVYVADITYISTIEGFCYLSLVTDLYSRKIVGYCLSKSLSIDGCLTALKMALKGVKHPEKLIHHSDRGIQYCSAAYVRLLEKNHVKISMTEDDHVYENAVAERVNGILKNEFMLGEQLISFQVAQKLVAQSIKIYNNERPHLSLDYRTPSAVYSESSDKQNKLLSENQDITNETTDHYDSNVDNSKVIHTESTSYPHKNGTYQHISECFKLLKLYKFID